MEQDIDPVAFARRTRTPVYARVRFGIVDMECTPDVMRYRKDCETILAKHGATGAIHREPTVCVDSSLDGSAWVMSMARYFPGDEPTGAAA